MRIAGPWSQPQGSQAIQGASPGGGPCSHPGAVRLDRTRWPAPRLLCRGRSPAFTGRFFMKPPWKPYAPAASAASAPGSFSSSLCLSCWASCAGPVRWATAPPGNGLPDSPHAGARRPGSAAGLGQNNSTAAGAIAWWRCVWQYAARARPPARYTSGSPPPILPRSPPITSPPRWPPTSAPLAPDLSSWFDATASPRVWYL